MVKSVSTPSGCPRAIASSNSSLRCTGICDMVHTHSRTRSVLYVASTYCGAAVLAQYRYSILVLLQYRYIQFILRAAQRCTSTEYSGDNRVIKIVLVVLLVLGTKKIYTRSTKFFVLLVLGTKINQYSYFYTGLQEFDLFCSKIIRGRWIPLASCGMSGS